MSARLVGYARCSTDQQDLTAQRDALLGWVEAERFHVDHGLTGTNRELPGNDEAAAPAAKTPAKKTAAANTDAKKAPEKRTTAMKAAVRKAS